MTLLRWGPEYESGIPELDSDHKRFFEHINDLEISMMVGRSRNDIGQILQGIIAYTHDHFAVEEQRMMDVGYPNALLHKAEHQRFLHHMEEFERRSKSGAVGLSVEVLNFLRDWIKDHIKSMDLQFAAYYHEHIRKNKEI